MTTYSHNKELDNDNFSEEIDDIAVIGMSCRFPKSPDIEKYWENLRDGVDCVTRFSDEELLKNGVDKNILNELNYVKAAGVLDDITLFDAKLFGFSEHEAEILDPQNRIFMECVYEALSDAGYKPFECPGMVGIYAGSSVSYYLLYNLYSRLDPSGSSFNLTNLIYNDRDYLATQTAYCFNLRGPAMTVQTACSTSLVATHQACQALIGYECDMALAGGVTIRVPHRVGYLSQGSILSPHGRCRPFDISAGGTLPGSGAGVVVLKRLKDALEAGDNVLALIKGSAVNNDGSEKVAFTAPSIDGQEKVIRMALAVSDIDCRSVGYIEAHGTGTALGDPIEIEAIARAFGHQTEDVQFCAIGSVKSNFGHLDQAAGIAGLIKTILALKHGQIPPSLNFEAPNPKIDFEKSPVFVNTKLRNWPDSKLPKRAAVSSLGFGGTNCHMILEEYASPNSDREKTSPKVSEIIFERKSYWIQRPPLSSATSASEEGFVHPLLQTRLDVAGESQNVVRFESDFSRDKTKYLKDHKVNGSAILPAAAYVEMIIQASGLLLKSYDIRLEKLEIFSPISLVSGETQKVQTVVKTGDAKTLGVEIYSKSGLKDADWIKRAAATTRVDNAKDADRKAEPGLSVKGEEIDVEKHYSLLRSVGLEYGPDFKNLKKLWSEENSSLGVVKIPEHLADDDYWLHPALLDSCLQIATPTMLYSKDSVFLPTGIDEVVLFQKPGNEVWCRSVVHQSENDNVMTVDFTLFDDSGKKLAELKSLRSLKLPKAPAGKTAAETARQWLYKINWQTPEHSDAVSIDKASGTWLIFSDLKEAAEELSNSLLKAGKEPIIIESGNHFESVNSVRFKLSPADDKDIDKFFNVLSDDKKEIEGVVFSWGMSATFSDDLSPELLKELIRETCGALLGIVRNLIRTDALKKNFRLLLFTKNAAAVEPASRTAPLRSMIWGMGNAIRLEHPELNAFSIDLDSDDAHETARLIFSEVDNTNNHERQIAHFKGERKAARLSRLYDSQTSADVLSQPYSAEFPDSGILSEIRAGKLSMPEPKANEVLVKTLTSGMNFKDVLVALGMISTEGFPGGECCGEVVKLGSEAKGLSVGQRVVCVTDGCFSSHVTAPAELTVPVPDTLGSVDAATVPIVFITAHYALNYLAKIKSGDRILIHSAAGGVGLAAVQIAKAAGAVIYATAGKEEKRAYLNSLGARLAMSSRSLDFAEQILEDTNGEGVDIVLNSLSNEFIPAGLSVVSPGGSFVEIGKMNIWDKEKVRDKYPRVSYHIVALDQITTSDPGFAGRLMKEVISDLSAEKIQPVPSRVYPMSDIAEAFEFMREARHIGKIVISHSGLNNELRKNATYLITGGFGELGLETAGYLASKGAGSLLLTGRGSPSAEAINVINRLKESGTDVITRSADVRDFEEVRSIVEEIESSDRPLAGVVHAAGTLDDRPIRDQNRQTFETPVLPKVIGSWNLHLATKNLDLDFFVMFSSLSSILGWPNQVNYAAANSFMDSLAHYRRSLGLVGTSINWGPWTIGMAAKTPDVDKILSRSHIEGISPQKGVIAFSDILKNGHPQAAVLPINNWSLYIEKFCSDKKPTFFNELGESEIIADDSGKIRAELDSLPLSEKTSYLQNEIAKIASRLLGEGGLDLDMSLIEAGFDSLKAVELRNALARAFEASLPSTILFDYPSVNALASFIGKDVLKIGEESFANQDNASDELTWKSAESSTTTEAATRSIEAKEPTEEELIKMIDDELDLWESLKE